MPQREWPVEPLTNKDHQILEIDLANKVVRLESENISLRVENKRLKKVEIVAKEMTSFSSPQGFLDPQFAGLLLKLKLVLQP